MIQRRIFSDDRTGQLLLAAIGLVSIMACSSPHAAEVPRPGGAHPDLGGGPPGQPSPEQERILLRDFLTNSGPIRQTIGPSIRTTVNALFEPLFKSLLNQSADFKCFKDGCMQETVVADSMTLERLDQAILAPNSRFLGLPGTVHRGAPIKLVNGGFRVAWAILIGESEYSMLADALKLPGQTHKIKR
jgi:hypothetical protein